MPLSNLNEQQYAAATAPLGHNLIIASAGTGKTSTIVGRIAHLLESGVKPSEILLLTFTNKASQEMIERVGKRFGNIAKKIESGTFHAVSYRYLREKYSISLKQPKELKVLFKSIAQSRVYVEQTSTPPYSAQYLFDIYSLFVNASGGLDFAKWLEGYTSSDHSAYIPIYEGIFDEYAELKKSYNYMDYNDLLVHYAKEMAQIKCPYAEILCDEYQDTNPLQNQVINSIAPKSLFCVGDYDQSIYAFNGADISIISNFTKTYADSKVWTLSKNYRSTRYILDLANQVIQKNERVYPKQLEVIKQNEPIPPKLLAFDELLSQYHGIAQRILSANHPLEDIAIIYRNNSSADGCEACLRELNIPSKRKGGVSFFDAKEVALLLDICSLLHNGKDMMSHINVLSYGQGIGNAIGKEIYDALCNLSTNSTANNTDNGNAKIGLLNPNKEIRPYAQRAKNSQIGLFDDFFALQDSKRFDSVIKNASFASHPILSHPKLNEQGAEFLDMFYELVAEANPHTHPSRLITQIAKSRLYTHITKLLCNQRAKNKDGIIDENLANDAMEKIQRKVILLSDIAKNYENLGRFLNAMILGSSENTQGSGVNLLTIHASKGLEFGMVFVIDLMDGRFPNRKLISKGGSIEEERRLFYVAITRAKEILYLSYAKKDALKSIDYAPSLFLYEANMIKKEE
ncbi:ATP-dependent helicase [Helicobacter sp. T3_23-1056]